MLQTLLFLLEILVLILLSTTVFSCIVK